MRKATFIVMLGIAVAVIAGMSPLKWKTTSIDLGQVTKNESKELSFDFTNSTGQAITILEAKGSCGCTNVKFPKDEIKPGESASVTASFKSGKVGTFKKNIRIKTSASEEYTYLHFKGEVVE
ncbi:Protein of unknown function [Ekhidna lutea]|uniref:DUF1573 domain-containing protein n=1 Tax=Ekhidna lutea TaxID=447679 RepID=A0A239IDZ6_EKHLU|nr:DUF1573 domain-containing protein [Ekhidna lutea]SNS91791.1 Protein of unknown function [Ekhidna lutea]